jgi:hypothetical protein
LVEPLIAGEPPPPPPPQAAVVTVAVTAGATTTELRGREVALMLISFTTVKPSAMSGREICNQDEENKNNNGEHPLPKHLPSVVFFWCAFLARCWFLCAQGKGFLFCHFSLRMCDCVIAAMVNQCVHFLCGV